VLRNGIKVDQEFMELITKVFQAEAFDVTFSNRPVDEQNALKFAKRASHPDQMGCKHCTASLPVGDPTILLSVGECIRIACPGILSNYSPPERSAATKLLQGAFDICCNQIICFANCVSLLEEKTHAA
jgi:hypothetical protein